MRTKLNGPLVLIAAWFAASLSVAQTPLGPALLPPPEAASRVGTDASSTPWYPPTAAASHSAPAEEVLPLPDAIDGQIETGDIVTPDINIVRVEPDASWYQPSYWLSQEFWDTTVELGLNGSAGTSDSLSLRTGGSVNRASPYSKLKLSSYYNRTTKGGTATQNNANFDVRNDWLLDESSPWMLYGTANVFYDQFQAFDLQTNASTGVGYRLINEPGLELIGRFGGGASRKFGGLDERWIPESLLGFEFNQRLSKAQKFYGKLDYFPEWDRVGEFRLVADTGWELALVEPSNLSLKISASDRFDSAPGGTSPHLVNYSVLLLLKL